MTELFNAADAGAPGHYTASQTALMLCDYHAPLLDRIGGTDGPVLEAAARTRNWALSNGVLVIHNLIDTSSTPFPTAKGYDRLAATVAAAKEDPSKWDEPSKLTESSGGGEEVTFTRRIGHVSALKAPGILDFLEKRGIKSLFVMGISTSGCVLRTAFAACDAEFVVTVLEDGCADPKESAHDILVQSVLSNRGWVSTSKEFIAGFGKFQS